MPWGSRGRGFTLIELVIVITILGILAAVAFPVFQDMQKQAKDAATKGALAGIREAIQQSRMRQIVQGNQPGVPADSHPENGCPAGNNFSYDQDPDGPWVMENGIMPDNPWARGIVPSGDENQIMIAPSTSKGTLCNPGGAILHGWCYNPNECAIWANTNVNGGPITENLF